ncbi:hypothetical protein ABZP36_029108 [Zizania latifolia]
MASHSIAPFIKDCNHVLRVLRDETRWDDMCAVYVVYACSDEARDSVDKAGALQMAMENEGIVPTVVTYNAVIHGLFKSGNVEASQMKFVEMKIR